jgi:hypothetical protein
VLPLGAGDAGALDFGELTGVVWCVTVFVFALLEDLVTCVGRRTIAMLVRAGSTTL